MVVAGGFHTNGLERILKEKGIAYAVVTPKIASLAGQENYSKVMDGDVSFKEFLKTTYFDALMRHSAKALSDALPLQEQARMLKIWRDNVIRELASQGRIAEAGKYLPYIDELLTRQGEGVFVGPQRSKEEILAFVRKELDQFKKDSFGRIWKTFEFQLGTFTGGLKELVSKKELNTQTVAALIERAGQSKPSFLAQFAAMDPSIGILNVAFQPSAVVQPSPEVTPGGMPLSSPGLTAGASNTVAMPELAPAATVDQILDALDRETSGKTTVLHNMDSFQSAAEQLMKFGVASSDLLEKTDGIKATPEGAIDQALAPRLKELAEGLQKPDEGVAAALLAREIRKRILDSTVPHAETPLTPGSRTRYSKGVQAESRVKIRSEAREADRFISPFEELDMSEGKLHALQAWLVRLDDETFLELVKFQNRDDLRAMITAGMAEDRLNIVLTAADDRSIYAVTKFEEALRYLDETHLEFDHTQISDGNYTGLSRFTDMFRARIDLKLLSSPLIRERLAQIADQKMARQHVSVFRNLYEALERLGVETSYADVPIGEFMVFSNMRLVWELNDALDQTLRGDINRMPKQIVLITQGNEAGLWEVAVRSRDLIHLMSEADPFEAIKASSETTKVSEPIRELSPSEVKMFIKAMDRDIHILDQTVDGRGAILGKSLERPLSFPKAEDLRAYLARIERIYDRQTGHRQARSELRTEPASSETREPNFRNVADFGGHKVDAAEVKRAWINGHSQDLERRAKIRRGMLLREADIDIDAEIAARKGPVRMLDLGAWQADLLRDLKNKYSQIKDAIAVDKGYTGNAVLDGVEMRLEDANAFLANDKTSYDFIQAWYSASAFGDPEVLQAVQKELGVSEEDITMATFFPTLLFLNAEAERQGQGMARGFELALQMRSITHRVSKEQLKLAVMNKVTQLLESRGELAKFTALINRVESSVAVHRDRIGQQRLLREPAVNVLAIVGFQHATMFDQPLAQEYYERAKAAGLAPARTELQTRDVGMVVEKLLTSGAFGRSEARRTEQEEQGIPPWTISGKRSIWSYLLPEKPLDGEVKAVLSPAQGELIETVMNLAKKDLEDLKQKFQNERVMMYVRRYAELLEKMKSITKDENIGNRGGSETLEELVKEFDRFQWRQMLPGKTARQSFPSGIALLAQYVYVLDLLMSQWDRLQQKPDPKMFFEVGLTIMKEKIVAGYRTDKSVKKGLRDTQFQTDLAETFARLYREITEDPQWQEYLSLSRDYEAIMISLREIGYGYNASDLSVLLAMASNKDENLKKIRLLKDIPWLRFDSYGPLYYEDPVMAMTGQRGFGVMLMAMTELQQSSKAKIPRLITDGLCRYLTRFQFVPVSGGHSAYDFYVGVKPHDLSEDHLNAFNQVVAQRLYSFSPEQYERLFYLARHPSPEDGEDVFESRGWNRLAPLIGEGGPLEKQASLVWRKVLSQNDRTIAESAEALTRLMETATDETTRMMKLSEFFLAERLRLMDLKYPVSEINGKKVTALISEHRRLKALDPANKTELESFVADRSQLDSITRGESEEIPVGTLFPDKKIEVFYEYVQRVMERSQSADRKNEAHTRNRSWVGASDKFPMEDANGLYLHGTDVAHLSGILRLGNLAGEARGAEAGADGFLGHADFSRLNKRGSDFSATVYGTVAGRTAEGSGQILLAYRRPGAWEPGTEYNGHGPEHALMLGGMPSTETSAIILTHPDSTLEKAKRAVARNGFYIPIYSKEGELRFSQEDYDKLRDEVGSNRVTPILDQFSGIPSLTRLYESKVDATMGQQQVQGEGTTLRQHTAMAMFGFETLFSGEERFPSNLPKGIDREFVMKVLAVHDIGKFVERGRQHPLTVEMLKNLKGLPFTEPQLQIAIALLQDDLIGEYLKSGDADTLNKSVELLDQSYKKWNLEITGLTVGQFFSLYKMIHAADIFAYTDKAVDEGGVPGVASIGQHLLRFDNLGKAQFDVERGRPVFAEGTETRYRNLEAAVAGVQQSAESIRSEMRTEGQGKPQSIPADVREALNRYDLGAIKTISRMPGDQSTLAESYRVDTDKGSFVISPTGLRKRPAAITWEASFLKKLDLAIVPVMMPAKSGEPFAEFSGSYYTVRQFKSGDLVGWGKIQGEKLINAAKALAQFHDSSAKVYPQGENLKPSEYIYPLADLSSQQEMIRFFARARDDIASDPAKRQRKAHQFYIDSYDLILDHVKTLQRNASRGRYDGFLRLIVHGDFNSRNLLFESDILSSLLDYDYSRNALRIQDIANGAIPINWTEDRPVDFASLIEFLNAYQQESRIPLTQEEVRLLPDAYRAWFLEEMAFGVHQLENEGWTDEQKIDWLRGIMMNLNALDVSLERGDWEPVYQSIRSEAKEDVQEIERLFEDLKIPVRKMARAMGLYVTTPGYSMDAVNFAIDEYRKMRQGPLNFTDAGSGQGPLAFRVAKKHPDLRVTGIEFDAQLSQDSQDVLNLAKARGLEWAQRVVFVRDDFNSPESQKRFKDADIVYYIEMGTTRANDFVMTLTENLKPGAMVITIGAYLPDDQKLPLMATGMFDVVKYEQYPDMSVYVRRSESRTEAGAGWQSWDPMLARELDTLGEMLAAAASMVQPTRFNEFPKDVLEGLQSELNKATSQNIRSILEIMEGSIHNLQRGYEERPAEPKPGIPPEALEAFKNKLNDISGQIMHTFLISAQRSESRMNAEAEAPGIISRAENVERHPDGWLEKFNLAIGMPKAEELPRITKPRLNKIIKYIMTAARKGKEAETLEKIKKATSGRPTLIGKWGALVSPGGLLSQAVDEELWRQPLLDFSQRSEARANQENLEKIPAGMRVRIRTTPLTWARNLALCLFAAGSMMGTMIAEILDEARRAQDQIDKIYKQTVSDEKIIEAAMKKEEANKSKSREALKQEMIRNLEPIINKVLTAYTPLQKQKFLQLLIFTYLMENGRWGGEEIQKTFRNKPVLIAVWKPQIEVGTLEDYIENKAKYGPFIVPDYSQANEDANWIHAIAEQMGLIFAEVDPQTGVHRFNIQSFDRWIKQGAAMKRADPKKKNYRGLAIAYKGVTDAEQLQYVMFGAQMARHIRSESSRKVLEGLKTEEQFLAAYSAWWRGGFSAEEMETRKGHITFAHRISEASILALSSKETQKRAVAVAASGLNAAPGFLGAIGLDSYSMRGKGRVTTTVLQGPSKAVARSAQIPPLVPGTERERLKAARLAAVDASLKNGPVTVSSAQVSPGKGMPRRVALEILNIQPAAKTPVTKPAATKSKKARSEARNAARFVQEVSDRKISIKEVLIPNLIYPASSKGGAKSSPGVLIEDGYDWTKPLSENQTSPVVFHGTIVPFLENIMEHGLDPRYDIIDPEDFNVLTKAVSDPGVKDQTHRETISLTFDISVARNAAVGGPERLSEILKNLSRLYGVGGLRAGLRPELVDNSPEIMRFYEKYSSRIYPIAPIVLVVRTNLAGLEVLGGMKNVLERDELQLALRSGRRAQAGAEYLDPEDLAYHYVFSVGKEMKDAPLSDVIQKSVRQTNYVVPVQSVGPAEIIGIVIPSEMKQNSKTLKIYEPQDFLMTYKRYLSEPESMPGTSGPGLERRSEEPKKGALRSEARAKTTMPKVQKSRRGEIPPIKGQTFDDDWRSFKIFQDALTKLGDISKQDWLMDPREFLARNGSPFKQELAAMSLEELAGEKGLLRFVKKDAMGGSVIEDRDYFMEPDALRRLLKFRVFMIEGKNVYNALSHVLKIFEGETMLSQGADASYRQKILEFGLWVGELAERMSKKPSRSELRTDQQSVPDPQSAEGLRRIAEKYFDPENWPKLLRQKAEYSLSRINSLSVKLELRSVSSSMDWVNEPINRRRLIETNEGYLLGPLLMVLQQVSGTLENVRKFFIAESGAAICSVLVIHARKGHQVLLASAHLSRLVDRPEALQRVYDYLKKGYQELEVLLITSDENSGLDVLKNDPRIQFRSIPIHRDENGQVFSSQALADSEKQNSTGGIVSDVLVHEQGVAIVTQRHQWNTQQYTHLHTELVLWEDLFKEVSSKISLTAGADRKSDLRWDQNPLVGLTQATTEEVMSQVKAGGVDGVEVEMTKRAELRRAELGANFDLHVREVETELNGQADPAVYVQSARFGNSVHAALDPLGDAKDLDSLVSKVQAFSLGGELPDLAGEENLVDAKVRLDHAKIAEAQARLENAIAGMVANAKGPLISILMDLPTNGEDGEIILKSFGETVRRLCVLYNPKLGQNPGRALNQPGRVVTLLNYNRQEANELAQKVISGSDENWAFLPYKLNLSGLGIPSFRSGIRSMADTDLKRLAMTVIFFAMQKYAMLSKAQQQAIGRNAELLKGYLDDPAVTSLLTFTGDGVSISAQTLVQNFMAEQDIGKAA